MCLRPVTAKTMLQLHAWPQEWLDEQAMHCEQAAHNPCGRERESDGRKAEAKVQKAECKGRGLRAEDGSRQRTAGSLTMGSKR